MLPITSRPRRPREGRITKKMLLALVAVGALGGLGGSLFLVNIATRQQEGRTPYLQVVALTDTTTDPAIWGKNFPQHYDDYLRTVDQERTKFGGSEALPHTPTDRDPRTIVAQSRLEEDPRLVEFWLGYAFSKDFREERGHAYMLEDQIRTERQVVVQQPGTCLQCHGSVYAPMIKAGNGNLRAGFDKLNATPYSEAVKTTSHPVSCVDCHDATTMALRITRPAFMDGIAAAKAKEGKANYDVNRDATRQEMRTFVCAQCHVEYHFSGPEKKLVFPWSKGLSADSMLAFYDSTGHKDWSHKVSGTASLKAQHPEFELWSQGVHARAGVACADCHMAYVRKGGVKITNHHVKSPLLDINRSCQGCHRASEAELKNRVETIQGRTYEMRNRALDASLALAKSIAEAVAIDSTSPAIAKARQHHRAAQFLTDFVEAENSMGFHAPQEAARVLARALDEARKGEIALRPKLARR
jgi:nitrite reductase (cytochrome c-552)